LLQENGYFVLRFLAEDVGKELDVVLDTILRALSRRGSPAVPVAVRRPS
jgi:very-short-patch-repair endonuclease